MPIKKHGLSRSEDAAIRSIYRAWVHMRERCLNEKHAEYKNYGERGITICKRWDIFSNFYKDMGAKPSAEHSLDRIDNNKGYSPANCRWATIKEQNSNKRNMPRRAYKLEEKRMQITQLLKQGLTTRAIAKIVGLGKSTVWKAAQNG